MKHAKSIDEYFSSPGEWEEELQQLRDIVRKTGLDEQIKWGGPVYSLNGKNVVGIGAFKFHVGLWFFQGALLDDPHNLLVNAQEGRTKAQRQMRFESAAQIKPRIIGQYLKQAIANAAAGKEIKPDRKKPLVIPEELATALNKDRKAKAAFENMSLSCRREYAEYVSEAKREETRFKRLERIMPMIREQSGLNDKYRSSVR